MLVHDIVLNVGHYYTFDCIYSKIRNLISHILLIFLELISKFTIRDYDFE